MSQRSDARVIYELLRFFPFRAGGGVRCQDLLQALISVCDHGAELIALEGASVLSVALLGVDGPAAILKPDEDTHDKKKRENKDQRDARDDDVHNTFGIRVGVILPAIKSRGRVCGRFRMP